MELKQLHRFAGGDTRLGLNRTFYGIETTSSASASSVRACLNRTFYGIETVGEVVTKGEADGLNRTFYGIETLVLRRMETFSPVLIVPFMELKPSFVLEVNA